MDMPKVEKCEIAECCYNEGGMCRALAITIGGDGAHPACDTYCGLQTKGGDMTAVAGVGACKVNECMYNRSLECTAPAIDVGRGPDQADCLTFRRK
jgi:hypothetical protein